MMPSPKRSRRGTLFVVALFMCLSGLIRMGVGTSHALSGSDDALPMVVSEETPACLPDSGALVMLKDLQEREARLIEREANLDDRSQAIALAKAGINEKLSALIAAEEKLSATLTLANDAADDDVQRLVAVYEKMKPKDAAALFAEMDPEFAAGFVGKMRPEAAAAVLAGLDSKSAYTISVLLAGRNANAPRQ